MQLSLPSNALGPYKSQSQRARVATEGWAAGQLYCPECGAKRLTPSAANTPSIDFVCPSCGSPFQLKSQSKPFRSRITDSAYSAMVRSIRLDMTPNLLALQYNIEAWSVVNLFLIPRFAFSISMIEKRKPLAPHARRAGWVGCNLLIGRIPAEARIVLVANGVAQEPHVVRRHYARLRPLETMNVKGRGWTLDVLSCIRSLGRDKFTLPDAYAFEEELRRMHPDNRHVRDKIRQQLQVLRDLEILRFTGRGEYCLL